MKKQIFILCMVVNFLTGCTQYHVRYAKVLDLAEQQNADYDSITNIDSIKLAVEYFDTYGSANERVRAHYLLGCAYRDMGDTPMALESFHNAANSADTTTTDCDDKRQLIRVHAQIADLFHKQLLPYEQLFELEKQYKYALLAKDTLNAINAIEHKGGAYELLNLPDSIISTRLSAYKLYKECGYIKEAARAVGPIIDPLLFAGRIEEAEQYQTIYEAESGYWENGSINKRKAIYNYTKGNYYLAKGKTDSARFFFQRLLSPELSTNHLEAGYRGLYQLYKKTGPKDSMAKYADLAYQLNDANYSSVASKEVQKMQALYNYTRSQKEASNMREKADRNRLMLMVTLVFLILILAIGSYIYQKRRKETELLQVQYQNTKDNLEKARKDLEEMEEEKNGMLEEKNNDIIMYEQQLRELEIRLNLEREKVTNEELLKTPIYQRFNYVLTHPIEKLHKKDWTELRRMIDDKIPHFYSEMNRHKGKLLQQDYDICILVRLFFSPSEICVLTGNSPSNVTMKRIRLLKRIFKIEGQAEEFDRRIQEIF